MRADGADLDRGSREAKGQGNSRDEASFKGKDGVSVKGRLRIRQINRFECNRDLRRSIVCAAAAVHAGRE